MTAIDDGARSPLADSAVEEATGSAGVRPAAIAGLAILVFSLWRVALAFAVAPGTDEAYSIAVSRRVELSYFDHPPLHYWIAHLAGQALGFGRAERLAFIALFAAGSWLMFLIGRRLFGPRAGLWATLALNLSAFFTVAAGGWVLPDGPLDLWLLAAFALLAEGWFGPGAGPRMSVARWLAVGICVGLAGLSKYQAALFCAGLPVFLVTTSRRSELARPGPYLAALVALAVLSPVLIWNAGHGWASIAFQSGRGAATGLHPLGSLIALAEQMGVLLPWIFAPLALAAVQAARAGPRDERRWLCLMLAAPAIVVFTFEPLLGRPGLPHWSMSGWLMLFPAAGELIARIAASSPWPRRAAIATATAFLAFSVLYAVDDATAFVGLMTGGRIADPTREAIDWRPVRVELTRRGLLDRPGLFVAAPEWSEAGKLDLALGGSTPVTVLSRDPREYGFLTDPRALVGRDALIVGRADLVNKAMGGLRPYFRSMTPLAPIDLGRSGLKEIRLEVVMASDMLRPYPLPYRGQAPGRDRGPDRPEVAPPG